MRSKRRAKRKTGINLTLKQAIMEKLRFELAENALLAFDFLMDDLFVCEIDRAIEMASEKAFLYMPKLSEDYPILDFSSQKNQYDETIEWARRNEPLQITESVIKKRGFLI
jgi:hypothetical protein